MMTTLTQFYSVATVVSAILLPQLAIVNGTVPLEFYFFTKMEVFMEKGVRGRAQTAGGELASRRNKKAQDFTHPFFQLFFDKSTLLST